MLELVEIQEHLETVKPGQPTSFTSACVARDTIRQGDLYLIVVDDIPNDYILASHKDADRQLVPGNMQGSKHCLNSLEGVSLFHPKEWSEKSLDGPCFKVEREVTVLHPTHGAVTIPAGLTILCRYQREFDKELAKERRARD